MPDRHRDSRDCGQDRARERRGDKRRMEERIAAGMCPKCGSAPPAPSRSRCESCLEKRNACVDCNAPSQGAARCPECARRSYLRSGEHRGLPAVPPTFFVIEIETGDTLSEWESLAEARASVAFAKIDPDTVAIEADIPMMSSLTSW